MRTTIQYAEEWNAARPNQLLFIAPRFIEPELFHVALRGGYAFS